PLAPAGPPVAKRLLREGMIEFDQDVFLGEGNEPKVLTLRVKPSRRGRLKKHLYKPAPLLIQLRTGDDQYYTYRLIPDMARTGFLINPLLMTNTDLIRLYGPDAGKQVVAFRIRLAPGADGDYQPRIAMTLEGVPDLVGGPMDAEDLNRIQFPTFENYPE